MKEKELISEVKNGNQQAFAKLIDLHKSLVFNTAMGFVHDKTTVDDITQDVFIRVWKAINDFRGESKFSTWLYRITVNISINYTKKNKISRLFTSIDQKRDENSKIFEVEDKKTVSGDDNFRKLEHAKALKTALNSLPKRQKTAFVLSKYEDLSYAEISEIMELSLSSVESLLHRAKKNLQKKLLNYYNENF